MTHKFNAHRFRDPNKIEWRFSVTKAELRNKADKPKDDTAPLTITNGEILKLTDKIAKLQEMGAECNKNFGKALYDDAYSFIERAVMRGTRCYIAACYPARGKKNQALKDKNTKDYHERLTDFRTASDQAVAAFTRAQATATK